MKTSPTCLSNSEGQKQLHLFLDQAEFTQPLFSCHSYLGAHHLQLFVSLTAKFFSIVKLQFQFMTSLVSPFEHVALQVLDSFCKVHV